MTQHSQPHLAAALFAGNTDPEDETAGPPVGAADAREDAIASGADPDATTADPGMATTGYRDSDGVPVGQADADADAIRSGADLDDDPV